MTSYLFQKIADRGAAQGIDIRSTTARARNWFRETALAVRAVNRRTLLNDEDNKVDSIDVESIGRMYAFFYDPKHKKTLPFYDKFPLVIVIGMKENGFLGLNLHYLPPVLRAQLMNRLYETVSNKKLDKTTKLRVNYQLLQGAVRFRYFSPCVKHYLFEHVQSDFLTIQPEFWDVALMLPTESFEKAGKEKVWSNSRSMI